MLQIGQPPARRAQLAVGAAQLAQRARLAGLERGGRLPLLVRLSLDLLELVLLGRLEAVLRARRRRRRRGPPARARARASDGVSWPDGAQDPVSASDEAIHASSDGPAHERERPGRRQEREALQPRGERLLQPEHEPEREQRRDAAPAPRPRSRTASRRSGRARRAGTSPRPAAGGRARSGAACCRARTPAPARRRAPTPMRGAPGSLVDLVEPAHPLGAEAHGLDLRELLDLARAGVHRGEVQQLGAQRHAQRGRQRVGAPRTAAARGRPPAAGTRSTPARGSRRWSCRRTA